MSLETRIQDLITAIGTDYKQFRTWITGSSSGDLSGLSTTSKTSLVSAINEVAAATGSIGSATTSAQGIVELATLTEVAAGTDSSSAVTPEGVRQERSALKAELLGGADAAWDTLNELKSFIDTDTSGLASLTTLVGTKADATSVYTKTDIGDVTTDFAAAYAAAKS